MARTVTPPQIAAGIMDRSIGTMKNREMKAPRHVRATLAAPLWLPGALGVAAAVLLAVTLVGHLLRALGELP